MQTAPNSSAPREVAVLLFPSFSNHCLANAIEPLRAVNRLSGRTCYRWRFVALDPGEVASSSGLTVKVEERLSTVSGDYLFVMPSYDVQSLDTPAMRRALRSARARFGCLAGLDTGSWLLAAAGLLDGRRATIHRELQIALAEEFPAVEVLPDRVVMGDAVMSCGGALTTFEMVLDLIERHHGAIRRLEVAALFLDGGALAQGAVPRPGRTAEAAMALMLSHIETPLSVDQLAAQLGMTRKRLERLCKARYGIGPRELYRAVRLREARRLIEETRLTVTEIALRCGYADPSAMTRAFGASFGETPRALRARLDQP